MEPSHVLELLTVLLQSWVDCAFPTERRSKKDDLRLMFLWFELPDILFSAESGKRDLFLAELTQLQRLGRKGDPPVEALSVALSEVLASGVRERFLVAAVRQTMDHMIQAFAPEAMGEWQRLAEDLLPVGGELTHSEEEGFWAPSSQTKPVDEMIARAAEAAFRFRHRDLRAEHLLLAMLDDEKAIAGRALRELGMDMRQLRQSIEATARNATHDTTEPMGVELRRILDYAHNEARSQRPGRIRTTTGHFLVGILTEQDNVVVSAFAAQNMDLAMVRSVVLRMNDDDYESMTMPVNP